MNKDTGNKDKISHCSCVSDQDNTAYVLNQIERSQEYLAVSY